MALTGTLTHNPIVIVVNNSTHLTPSKYKHRDFWFMSSDPSSQEEAPRSDLFWPILSDLKNERTSGL